MVEKLPIPQEYLYKWKKVSLFWQRSTQKAVDWQGWLFAAYPRGGVSWKKPDAISIVGSFWVFKL